jgi:hypothetical protein
MSGWKASSVRISGSGPPRTCRRDTDLAQLERALTDAQDTRPTGSGLREDPVEAALTVLAEGVCP